MSLPHLSDASACAFFFDFDGTLAHIAATPGEVTVDAITLASLSKLAHAADGAIAVVSGREIASLDGFLAPTRFPAAGVHGLERRAFNGGVFAEHIDQQALAAFDEALTPWAAAYPGLLLERKLGAVALHYRARPELQDNCFRAMGNAAAGWPRVVLTRGKMVIEARFHAATKGTAITAFMTEAPFAGRTPVFAGDDVTDEDGFEVVNAMGGITIKVGPGETAADSRADSVGEFLTWLSMISDVGAA
ncbi:MAG: trehalose-phosphatase [Chitinophagales bacterium]|nr:trehalose-phosphatase [Hyphomicrobiales bacterium]